MSCICSFLKLFCEPCRVGFCPTEQEKVQDRLLFQEQERKTKVLRTMAEDRLQDMEELVVKVDTIASRDFVFQISALEGYWSKEYYHFDDFVSFWYKHGHKFRILRLVPYRTVQVQSLFNRLKNRIPTLSFIH